MAILSEDIATFDRMRADLEACHPKEWVVIHNGVFEGVFPDFEQAATYAVDKFDSEACLIRQLCAPPAVQLTGGMIFTPAHALAASRV
jgi:hypothetical protein